MSIRLSHSARDCYALCARKYYYKYVKKMRPRAKGSALYFGSCFDRATASLLEGTPLDIVKHNFSVEWIKHESNLNVKFAKSDYTDKLIQEEDAQKLQACIDNLNKSKPKDDYASHKCVLTLVKDLIKMGENPYIRDLTDKEELFTHYAKVLCMNRKGHLMLDSFNTNIVPHVTKVISTQAKVEMTHPAGHSVIGYIDLLCNMGGYKIPNGRELKPDEVVVVDIKSAGPVAWNKHDNILESSQLDTYLISDVVQTIQPTNLIAYFVVSKVPKEDKVQTCGACGHVKDSNHKTCNNEVDGRRCNGVWLTDSTLYCDAKIVIAERDINEAELIINDFDDTLTAIVAGAFPRNRDSCAAFGGVCEYKSVCGKCYKDESDKDAAFADWDKKYGEGNTIEEEIVEPEVDSEE